MNYKWKHPLQSIISITISLQSIMCSVFHRKRVFVIFLSFENTRSSTYMHWIRYSFELLLHYVISSILEIMREIVKHVMFHVISFTFGSVTTTSFVIFAKPKQIMALMQSVRGSNTNMKHMTHFAKTLLYLKSDDYSIEI